MLIRKVFVVDGVFNFYLSYDDAASQVWFFWLFVSIGKHLQSRDSIDAERAICYRL